VAAIDKSHGQAQIAKDGAANGLGPQYHEN
jgi:hypothetical protein